MNTPYKPSNRDRVVFVDSLAALMHKYGLSRLQCADVVLERPPFAVDASLPEPEREEDAEDAPDDFDKLKGMSPEAIDRALTLGPLGPK
jgi:hypothetical protein